MFWTGIVILSPIIVLTAVKTAIDYVYPGKIKTAAMKIGWHSMEICSKIEIYVTKLYKKYTPSRLKPPTPQLTIVYDGNEIGKYTMNEFINKRKAIYNRNYDFILYEIPIEKENDYDKYDKYVLRYEAIADVMHIEYNSLKGFELNMIQMIINGNKNKTYNIDFGRSQYILNGNILLDRNFLKWYLNTKYDKILNDEDHYTVTFIDHNMNYITLTHECYLLIKKNNYDIIYIEK